MIHTGVTDLAKEVGITASHASKLLNRGMTREQIRQKYRKHKEVVKVADSRVVGRRVANKAAKAVEAGVEIGTLESRVEPVQNGKKNGHIVLPVDERTSFTMADQIQAEIRKEMALASKHELDLAVKRGEYVPVVTVNEWFGNVIVKARDYFMRQPGELAERLAATEDVVQVQKLLEDAIVQGLEMLALLDGA